MKHSMRASFVCSLLPVVVALSSCGGHGDVQPGAAPASPTPTSGFNDAGGFNGVVRNVVPANDGTAEVYVLGDFTTYRGQPVASVVRLRPDGRRNEGFLMPSAITNRISIIASADDGSGDLYVGDSAVEGTSFPLTGVGHVWRLNADGTVDREFAFGTIIFESDAFSPDPVFRAVVRDIVPVGDGSGRVYAAVSGRYNGTEAGPVVRLNTNGSVDATFTQDRLVPSVFRIVPANDGSQALYIATFRRDDPGTWLSYVLLRLHGDGGLDDKFETGNSNYPDARIDLVAPVQDGTGDVLATGVFLNFAEPNPGGPFALRGLARFDPSGALDVASPRPNITSTAIVAFVKAGDGSGDWFVGERMGSEEIVLARYKPDGTRDPGFTVGRMNGTALNVMMPAPDRTGDLYVGGDFSFYNGVAAKNIARINSDGSLD